MFYSLFGKQAGSVNTDEDISCKKRWEEIEKEVLISKLREQSCVCSSREALDELTQEAQEDGFYDPPFDNPLVKDDN